MSKLFGSTGAGVLVIILVALVVILLLTTVNLNLRMTRLQRRYNLFMKGTDGVSVEKAMAERLREIGKIRVGQKQTSKGLDQLQNQYDRMLCKYGIVKYDAFEDVGGKMSFALAMLDQTNTGFVLNAIHSRDNCFLYLKDVVKGTSYIMLSDEEVEALRRAARSGEDAALADKPAKKRSSGKAKQEKTAAGGEAQAAERRAERAAEQRAEEAAERAAERRAEREAGRKAEEAAERRTEAAAETAVRGDLPERPADPQRREKLWNEIASNLQEARQEGDAND